MRAKWAGVGAVRGWLLGVAVAIAASCDGVAFDLPPS
jgi:hypothetical protein